MTSATRSIDDSVRRLVCGDWMAAFFAIAFYLQLHAVVARRLPSMPEDVLFAAALLAVVVLRFRYGALATLTARRLALASLPWVLAALLSGLDPYSTFFWRDEMMRAASWALMGVMLASLLDTRAAMLNAVCGLVAAGAVVGALNAHQFLTSAWHRDYFGLAGAQLLNIHGRVDGYRAIGPADDPNYHAQFLLPLLAMAIERTWSTSGRARLLAAVATACVGCGLTLTYSRAALLVMGVLASIALVAALRWRVPMTSLALTLAAALVAVAVGGPALIDRVQTLPALAGIRESPADTRSDIQDRALSGRLSENLAALEMFRDHPWNGVGLGSFPWRYREYATRIGLDQRPLRHPHNLYLEVAAETGVFGVIGLLTLLGALFATLVRTRRGLLDDGDGGAVRLWWGIVMALGAYLLTALFLHLTYRSMLWALLAIGFATPVLRRGARSS